MNVLKPNIIKILLPVLVLLLYSSSSLLAQPLFYLMQGEDILTHICDSEGSYELVVSISGGVPGVFHLQEAGTYTEVSGHIVDDDPDDDRAILLAPGLDGDYLAFYAYTNGDGFSDTTEFSVRMPLSDNFLGLPDTVCLNDDPYPMTPLITVSLPGDTYTYTGQGVSGSFDDGFFFDPLQGTTVPGNVSILMHYITEEACEFDRNGTVYERELPAVNGIAGLPEFTCMGDDPYPILPDVSFPDPLAVYQMSGPGVTGNQASGYYFDPSTDGLASGMLHILLEYTAYTGCTVLTEDSVMNYELPVVTGIKNFPDSVCRNDAPYLLLPDVAVADPLASYAFSGPGISGSQASGYYFNPSSGDLSSGFSSIQLYYSSQNGCDITEVFSVYNRLIPELNFSSSPACVPESGGDIQFTNLSSGKYYVDEWTWDFGDPESGDNNISHESAPRHYYPGPGNREVSLTALTDEGCTNSYSRVIALADQPVADFTWLSDCFVMGEESSFLSKSSSEYAAIDTLIWTFQTSSGGLIKRVGTGDPTDTISITFSSLASYNITLYVENEVGCSGRTTRQIALKPTYVLDKDGYYEDFNESAANWLIDSPDGLESWLLGEPGFTDFEAVSGDHAWYTKLPIHTDGYVENSWVQSPCFDLSALNNPMVQFDLMKSFMPGADGAVLQYQDVMGEGWKTIGLVGEGENWYNNTNILSKPGGSTFGWSLDQFDPDKDWVHASCPMNELSNMASLKFRLAIGSGGTQESGNQGFAFDNFFIGDRQRISVLEHFTNSGSSEALDADLFVEQYVKDHPGLLIDLQYHTDYPGEDSMNLNNPVPPAIRHFNYGVPDVPYAVFNGGNEESHRFDFSDSSEEPGEEIILAASLERPAFDIALHSSFHADRLEGWVKVTCTEEAYASNIQLYVVVVEREVTAYKGAGESTAFRQVVLDILPDPTGKLLGNNWSSGDDRSTSFSWDYAPYVEDVDDLQVVAFVFDRDQKEILQAASMDYELSNGLRDTETRDNSLHLYPNPARDYVYLNFGQETSQPGEIILVDTRGRIVYRTDVTHGYRIQQLDVSRFTPGLYMLLWTESGELRGKARLIKTQ